MEKLAAIGRQVEPTESTRVNFLDVDQKLGGAVRLCIIVPLHHEDSG